LFVAAHEFERSLDAFPFEFGAILADHAVASGADPCHGLRVDPSHLRHACEVQARSHLLHLREGFLETRGRTDALAELLLRSAPPLAALLQSVVRLEDSQAASADAAAAVVERKVGVRPEASRTSRGSSAARTWRPTMRAACSGVPRRRAAARRVRRQVESRVTRRRGQPFGVWRSTFVGLGIAGRDRRGHDRRVRFNRTFAQAPLPELTKPVNDFANIINPADEQQLDTMIRRLQEATGDAVVIATVDTAAPFATPATTPSSCSRTAAAGSARAARTTGC
jgi:hypothetical protein